MNLKTLALDESRGAVIREGVIDVSRPATDRWTFLRSLVSWATGAGIALLVPFIIMLIGLPVVLAASGVVAAASWLFALLMS
jgi:hypothetical protein